MRYSSAVTGKHKEVPDTPSGSDAEDRDRVALAYNTLPERIRIVGPAVDVFDEWSLKDADDIDVSAFVDNMRAIFAEMVLDDIVKGWLADRADRISDALGYYVQMQTDALGLDIDVERFLAYDAADYKRSVLARTGVFRERTVARLERKASLSGSVEHTPFRPLMKSFVAAVPDEIPLPVVFDAYTPSPAVPAAVYAGVAKKHPGYSGALPPGAEDRAVFLRVSGNDTATIAVSQSHGIVAEYFVFDGEDDREVGAVVSGLLGGLAAAPPVAKYTGIQGVVYFLGHIVERYTFADFVMNDSTASSNFALNEFSVPSRDAGPVRIYDKAGGGVGVLSVKRVGEHSADARHLEGKASPGNAYIRLFVAKSASVHDAERFVARVSGLLHLYFSEYKKIHKAYKQYIQNLPEANLHPGFSVPPPLVRDPTIFVANYSRFCPHVPTPAADGVPGALEFPRGSGKHYVCTDPVYKYPGVRENNLSNAEEYPYVPCCFKTDQTSKPKYRAYYGGDAEHRVQIRMITTTKPLNPGFFGILPKELGDIVNSIDVGHTYLRHGVSRGPDSFLACLNTCMRKNMTRAKLLTAANAALCAQENPGRTDAEIASGVVDADAYLSPRLYVRLLEEVFNAHIFVFDRAGPVKYPAVQGRYSFRRGKRPVVLVYEHDDVQLCELIVAWDTESDTYVNVHHPSMVAAMEELEAEVHATWIGGKRLYPIPVPEFVPKCTAQYVDAHGKARGLVIDDVYVECDPLPPLNVPTVPKPESEQDCKVLETKYKKYFFGKDFVKLSPYRFLGTSLEAELETTRTARYLCDVFVYLYSAWAARTGRSAVAEFVAEEVRAAPGHRYFRPGPQTSRIPEVMDGPGFAAESREMVRRLVHVLRLALERSPARVKALHAKKYFDNYYASIADFRTGDFVIAPVDAQQEAETTEPVHRAVPVDTSEFVVDIDDRLWRAREVAVRADGATTYVYNSPEDIVKVIGDERTQLVYRRAGVAHAFELRPWS